MQSKAREGVKAMSLAFVLLDFQHAGVRRHVGAIWHQLTLYHQYVSKKKMVLTSVSVTHASYIITYIII